MVIYDPLYTVTDTAKALHISRQMVYKLIHAGKLPAIKIYDDSDLSVTGEDLEAYINGRRSKSKFRTELKDVDREVLSRAYA